MLPMRLLLLLLPLSGVFTFSWRSSGQTLTPLPPQLHFGSRSSLPPSRDDLGGTTQGPESGSTQAQDGADDTTKVFRARRSVPPDMEGLTRPADAFDKFAFPPGFSISARYGSHTAAPPVPYTQKHPTLPPEEQMRTGRIQKRSPTLPPMTDGARTNGPEVDKMTMAPCLHEPCGVTQRQLMRTRAADGPATIAPDNCLGGCTTSDGGSEDGGATQRIGRSFTRGTRSRFTLPPGLTGAFKFTRSVNDASEAPIDGSTAAAGQEGTDEAMTMSP